MVAGCGLIAGLAILALAWRAPGPPATSTAEVRKVINVGGSSSVTRAAGATATRAGAGSSPDPAEAVGELAWLSLPGWPGPDRLGQKVDEAKRQKKTHKVASLLWLGSLDGQALELARSLGRQLEGPDHHRNLALIRLRAALWKLHNVARHAQDEGNEESRELLRTCCERLSRQILELVVNPWASGLTEPQYRDCMVEINKFRARLNDKQVVRFEFLKALTAHLLKHAPPFFATPELRRAFPFEEAPGTNG